jgi:hypothetical protein
MNTTAPVKAVEGTTKAQTTSWCRSSCSLSIELEERLDLQSGRVGDISYPQRISCF